MASTYRRTLRSVRGFTIFELLTVLVLLGIMLSLVVPAMDRVIAGAGTSRALDQLSADIAYARILAVRSGYTTSLRFNPDGSYDIVVESNPERTAKSVSLSSEYAGVRIIPPTPQVSFDSRGIVTASTDLNGGWFTARRNAEADSLSLSLAGQVYRAY